MGGGYASALAQGTAQQSNAMGAQVQTDRSALARARALQGMEAAGQLGSEMRRQGAAERGQRANAVDAFNEANTGYRRDVEQRDVNRQNERIGQIADARMGRALNYDRQAGQSAARGQQYANSFTTLAKDAQKSDNRNTNPNSDGSY